MFQAKDLGLYIHIPFCKTICVYCAFSTFANKNSQVNAYIEALIREIKEKSVAFANRPLKTIYFGGGTPSILETTTLKQILDTVHESFDTRALQSVEIECNPESLSLEKIQAYRALGITRISVGIQTLHDKSLWKIARPHNGDIALKALEDLNTAGFANFGCDLIIGLPYQTLESFQSDVKKLLSFQPAHLSTYFLSMDTLKIQTFIADSPSEDEQVAMYEWADEYLTGTGFLHYEVSNYALPGSESKHNLRYWNRQEYLGVGLSAHSYYNQTVFENNHNFTEYLQFPGKSIFQLKLENDLLINDYILLLLRLQKGIELASFKKLFGKEKTSHLLTKSKSWIEDGYLTITPSYLAATNKGRLLLDTITKKLCL